MTKVFVLVAFIAFNTLAYNQCDSSCSQCWGPDNYQCLQCSGNYLWIHNICSPLDTRSISGWGRPCVECGEYNYPLEGKCYPCLYPARVCNQDQDLVCKVELGFELNQNICECVKGVFRDGRCFCQEKNHYVNADGDCMPCDFTTRKERGCNPICPSGYYDSGNDCLPCHYTCSECSLGTGENDCDVCKSQFEFVMVNLKKYCLCPCETLEINKECIQNVIRIRSPNLTQQLQKPPIQPMLSIPIKPT